MEGQVLTQASGQWATRPDDQRYLTLEALRDAVSERRQESWTLTTVPRDLRLQAEGGGAPGGGRVLVDAYDVVQGSRRELEPTNWSFGQLAQYAQAPASYLRKLPAELAAINLQWGLEHNPIRDNVLVLGRTNGAQTLRSMTSTSYGRIWDRDVVAAVERVNVDGRWQIPAASYTASNPKRATTLYASDRDVFIFLVDPERPIEVNGEALYRGFMTWNSEVGAATFGLTTFLYRTVCDNRLIWGATDVRELRIRHTGGAPDRFAYEGARYLQRYAEESAAGVQEAVRRAQDYELPASEREGRKAEDAWGDWLQKRGFSATQARNAVSTAQAEEGEARSLWDIVNGVTASARQITHTNERVELETKAGKLMRLVEA